MTILALQIKNNTIKQTYFKYLNKKLKFCDLKRKSLLIQIFLEHTLYTYSYS